MIETLLTILHITVCILLIVIVLLQSGKSADLAGAFGGYGSQSTFGPRGTATFLSKMTTTLAILFMVTTLLLMIFSAKASSNTSGSVLGGKDESKKEQKSGTQKPTPVQPTTPEKSQPATDKK